MALISYSREVASLHALKGYYRCLNRKLENLLGDWFINMFAGITQDKYTGAKYALVSPKDNFHYIYRMIIRKSSSLAEGKMHAFIFIIACIQEITSPMINHMYIELADPWLLIYHVARVQIWISSGGPIEGLKPTFRLISNRQRREQ